MIQRHLPKCEIERLDTTQFTKVIHSRDDYIRWENDYDKWLLNPAWTIHPSISFKGANGPHILTCRFHDRGNARYMIHTPRIPKHILPAAKADQLAYTVIKPRTIRPMKAATYSTAYQMHEQRGSFNGIDTCSITSFGNFDFCSNLSLVDESRAIRKRPDMKGLLSTLAEEKVISKFIASERLAEAMEVTEGICYDKYMSGGTYVPLNVALEMQNETTNGIKKISVAIVHSTSETTEITVDRYWPVYIYPCQTMSEYGVMPHIIPKLVLSKVDRARYNSNCRKIWTVISLLVRIEVLWNMVAAKEMFQTDNWCGRF